ncbi:MAG TPA: hypothetical protein VLE99_01580 [Candidatus Saccharimonadales bacterium]|nr:hypothetical protein [Candidatus Saccharimonadales bacterium]
MSQDDPHYTYNPLSNEDKELLLRHGYRPGELSPDEARDLLNDLRLDNGDNDGDRLSTDIPADER